MHELLHTWLASQHVLGIPGWGTLHIITTTPEIDFVNKQINPPQQQIDFKEETPQADKKFYQWLASALDTDEITAIRRYNDFITDTKDQLLRTGSAILPGIGLFQNTEASGLLFKQQEPDFDMFPTIRAEKIMRHQESFNVLQGDMDYTSLEAVQHLEFPSEATEKNNWGITALILFAAGALAILYYYMS